MTRTSAARLAIAVLLMLSLTACAGPGDVTFQSASARLKASELEALARAVDIAGYRSVAASDAPDLRMRALTSLRTRGDEGDRAASLLTTGFPERTIAIPVLVRIADVDGRKSVIVVEAAAGKTGDLTARRLWVFDYATGEITKAALLP